MGRATYSRYGTIWHDKFHDGEPVFVFRAADHYSLAILEQYGEMVGHIPGVRARVLAELDRFQEWQANNALMIREPD